MRLILLLLALVLSACTFTYLPPIPQRKEVPQMLSLSQSEGLILEERLTLKLRLAQIPQEDWLVVQWYAPDNDMVASDAQWLHRDMTSVTFQLPEDVAFYEGHWRAIVFYQSEVLRLFSFEMRDASYQNSFAVAVARSGSHGDRGSRSF